MLRWLALVPLLVLIPGRAPVVLDPPTGPDDVIVRISRGAGMTTMENAFASHPDLLVVGDGTVYRSREHGVETFRVDRAQILTLLRDADGAGLLQHSTKDLMAEGIMDAGSTFVTLDAGRVRHTHAVYALGIRGGYGGLASYVDHTLDWADAQRATPYQPTAYRVLTQDDSGYHCATSDTPVAVDGSVLAVTALLPGDRCEWDW